MKMTSSRWFSRLNLRGICETPQAYCAHDALDHAAVHNDAAACTSGYCNVMTHVNLALPDFRYAPGMPPDTAHLYLRMACKLCHAAASTESTCCRSPAAGVKPLECVEEAGCVRPPQSSVCEIDNQRALRSASACGSTPDEGAARRRPPRSQLAKMDNKHSVLRPVPCTASAWTRRDVASGCQTVGLQLGIIGSNVGDLLDTEATRHVMPP